MTEPHTPNGRRISRDDDGDIEDESICERALKMQHLAQTFPTLNTIPGIDPWDVHRLGTESILGVSTGTRHSILVLISMWNPSAPEYFGLEPFDIHDALQGWDTNHRRAFIAWASTPWWV